MSVALREAPLSPSCDEHELVARVRLGDDRAFEALYARYQRRIAAYVRGMVRDPGRAEEITQDVFLSAFRRMRDTERPIAFKPWIYEIAKNACIDNARRARHGHEVPLEIEDESLGHLSLDGPTLEHAIATRQQLDDLRGAFGCLSESHHRILVLRELEGLSYQQIGERMGMSRAIVESTLFRARRRLSEEYDELVSGRRCAHVHSVVTSSRPQALGTRERRRLARHLSHCQPCRRHAASAGFDIAALKPRRVASRVAALFPLPLLRLPWRLRQLRGGRPPGRGAGAVSRLGTSPALTRSADAIASLPDPTLASISLSRAAAAVAAIALTGAGGGFLVTASLPQPRAHRAAAPHAAQAPTDGAPRARTGAGSNALVSARRGAPGGSFTDLQGPRRLTAPVDGPASDTPPSLPGGPPRAFGRSAPQPPLGTSGSPLRSSPAGQSPVSVPGVPAKLVVPSQPGNPLPSSGVGMPKVGSVVLPNVALPQNHAKR